MDIETHDQSPDLSVLRDGIWHAHTKGLHGLRSNTEEHPRDKPIFTLRLRVEKRDNIEDDLHDHIDEGEGANSEVRTESLGPHVAIVLLPWVLVSGCPESLG